MKATGKTCGGNDGCGKPKRQGFPQPWKSLRDSHIPTARLLLYIFPKPIPKGVFLTACTFSLQAHSSIRKDSLRRRTSAASSELELLPAGDRCARGRKRIPVQNCERTDVGGCHPGSSACL